MTSLALTYLNPGELAAHLAHYSKQVLGIAGFGRSAPVDSGDAPLIWVDMPVLGADTVFEVWASDTAVIRQNEDDIDITCNAEMLFGCFETHQLQGESIEFATFRAYTKIFDCIDRADYSHLWRVWHYFPQINATENALERYHGFNAGRHNAFLAKHRLIGEQNAPAACAVGSREGPLVIYFLAGRERGVPIENPRQTSAYHYPEQYGPRSPAFARAMLAGTGRDQKLFISGTASIVGHATQHAGDVAAQTRETLANIRALLAQAKRAGFEALTQDHRLFLKVYLHHPDDLPLVRAQVAAEFGTMTQVVYLQANICRADLLLEIEGVCGYANSSPAPLEA